MILLFYFYVSIKIETVMSIPRSLSVNLQKFQAAQCVASRVNADRSTYSSSGVVSFTLPTVGVLDLSSLAMAFDWYVVTGANPANTVVTTPFHANIIRRMEISAGGQSLTLGSLNDYGFVYHMIRGWTSNKMRNDSAQILRDGNITFSDSAANTTNYYPATITDWLGLAGSPTDVRFLPLDLLPPLTITLYLHNSTRWFTSALPAGASAEIQNVRLNMLIHQFENNLLSNLWNDRLQKGGIQFCYQDVRYYEGSTTTSTAVQYTASVNSTSIDYVITAFRPSTYDTTPADALKSNCGNTTLPSGTTRNNDLAVNQLMLNGMPLSSMPLSPADVLALNAASLNGIGNALYAPDFGAVNSTYNDFKNNYFALIHRCEVPTTPEDGAFVSGVNTYGQAIPIDLQHSGGDASSRKPYIIVVCKNILELGAGKQVMVTV